MCPQLIMINRFYAPDHSATAQLLTDLAEHLAAQGGLVTIIASRLRYDDPEAALPARETLNGVTIRRVWTTRFGRAGLLGRSLDYASFYFSAFLALLAEARSGDTILAKTDPPLISIPAAVVAKLKGARLVNWCQDLFPETAASLGLRWAAGPIGQFLRRLRNWSLRQAAVNIALCDAMRLRLMAEAVPEERIRVIHNWPDSAIAPLPRDRAQGDPFIICYSGNLGRAHNVEAVLDLIDRTRDLPGLHWRFVGGGAGMSRLKAHIQSQATVTVEGYAPRSALAESLSRSDAHLISLDPACEGLIMPSKLYGILAAGRPVLFLGRKDGAVARILEAADAGLTLDLERPASWRPAIAALIADRDRRVALQRNARAAYERDYTRARALAAWREVLVPAPCAAAVTATGAAA